MNALLQKDLEHISVHTQKLWAELRNCRIFITGGTGFVGRWMLESFVYVNQKYRLNAKAFVLTRDPERFMRQAPELVNHSCIRLWKGDVRRFPFPRGTFKFIIHAATENTTGVSALELYHSNVEGTRRVLDFAKRCHARKLLFTSSGAVYGIQPSVMCRISEEYAGAPQTNRPLAAYGHSKRAAEFLCAAHAEKFGFEAKLARCFAFLGPFLPLTGNFAIGNFLHNALSGEAIKVKTRNRVYRSYLYASDLAIWLWTILFKGRSCQPYNVGSHVPITISDLARQVARAVDPQLQIKMARPRNGLKRIEQYVPDVSLARKELGLKMRVSLNSGIRRMADFYSKTLFNNSRSKERNG